jgi:cytochrome c-type biogenesis protein CcmH
MAHKILCFLIIIFAISVSANSQELTREQERRLSKIEGEIFSPFCPGKVLKDCPSSGATELKGELRSKLMAGESDTQIVAYLESLYGTEIHARPPMSGMGVWVWVVPGVFVLIGVVIFIFLMRRWAHQNR